MLMFDKIHIASDVWGMCGMAVTGYFFGKLSQLKKSIKDLDKLREEYAQVARKVDFQLKIRGCEGLSPEDMVSKVAVPAEQLKLED